MDDFGRQLGTLITGLLVGIAVLAVAVAVLADLIITGVL